MRILVPIGLALASPAAAQTPLCAWSGTALICPSQPSASIGPLTETGRAGIRPSPEQRLRDVQAQVDLDRAVIAARVGQAESEDRAKSLTANPVCAGAETEVRDARPGDLAGFAPHCAVSRK